MKNIVCPGSPENPTQGYQHQDITVKLLTKTKEKNLGKSNTKMTHHIQGNNNVINWHPIRNNEAGGKKKKNMKFEQMQKALN